MQLKNRSPETFLERTDAAAKLLGISLRQLPDRIGISPASLFGYRSGKIPLSDKAWSKLERLEAEISSDDRSNPVASFVQEESVPYKPGGRGSPADYLGIIEGFVDLSPEDTIKSLLKTMTEKLYNGDASAARDAEFLISLIKERRPDVFPN